MRIRDSSDTVAWNDFVSIYTPLIYDYSRRRRLQDSDASDVCQTVLLSLARSISGFQYDRSKGTFRSWLYTITHNEILKSYRKRGATDVVGLDDAEASDSLCDTDEDHWNRQHERHLFEWATKKVRQEFQQKTWHAFWMVAVDGHSVAETAASLGISTGATYIAKSRVTARLRQVIATAESC